MNKEKAGKEAVKSNGYWLESLGLESSLYDVLVFHNHDGSANNIYVDDNDIVLNDDEEEEKLNRFIHLNRFKHAKN